MSHHPVSLSPVRRCIGGAALVAALLGVAAPAPASASSPRAVKVVPERAATAARYEASAAFRRYGSLKRVGVSASGATLDGKTLSVTVKATKTVELRLAIVRGTRITAFKVVTLKRGSYRLRGRLNLTPRGSGLRLRITGRIRRTYARELFKINVKPAVVNAAPTGLTLSDASVAENAPDGTAVGVFTGTDPNSADTLRYALVAGAGDADNAKFRTRGSALNTNATFDFEAKSTYSIRARASDGRGGIFERVFAIRVVNANDAPADVAVSPSSVAENQPAGALVGSIFGSDPDGDALSYALVSGTGGEDNASFVVSGSALRTAASFDRESKASYSVRLRATDAAGASVERVVTVTVTDVNDAPLLSTTPGAVAYTENDPATVIDGGLSVSDADDTSLVSASVQLTGGLQAAGDELVFSDQAGIAGVYDAPTGRLALGGTATMAEYQAALRSVRFRSTGENPSTAARTVSFTVNDGDLDSAAATKGITVTAVDDRPAIVTSAGALSFTENDPATAIDGGLVLGDPDSAITGATVQITGDHSPSQDVLGLPAQPGITASFNPGTGTLTLSGVASAAAYQAALQAVTYDNTSSNPSPGTRTVTFLASDASSTSVPATRDIAITATNDGPDVDNSPGALAYTENQAATAIDPSISITDPDSATLTGATAQITGSYATYQDVLALPAQPSGITATAFDTVTGRLTLSGDATVAEYESALQAVTYRNSSDAPSAVTRTVTYQARDAAGFGSTDTHGITITPTDDAPVAVDNSATVLEDAAATAVPVLANDTDVDGGPKAISSVTQPDNGTVVVTGGGTGLTYAPNTNFCSPAPDTFTYTLTPGTSTATVSITVTCDNDTPVVTTSAGARPYTEGDAATAIDGGITVTDADDLFLDSAQVRISSGFQSGDALAFVDQNGISGNYNAGTGVLTLSPVGPVSVADFQTALRSVRFGTSNDTPVTSKTIEFKVNDGDNDSVLPTKEIAVTPVNDAPELDLDSGAAGGDSTAAFTEGGSPVVVAPRTAVADADDANMQSATVTLTNRPDNSAESLSADATGTAITAAAYDPLTGVLSLTGADTKAHYEQVLQTVRYANTQTLPETTSRQLEIKVNDGQTDSATRTATVTVALDNQPPVLDLNGGGAGTDSAATFTEGSGPVGLAAAATIADPDTANSIVSATATITNRQDGAAEALTASAPGLTKGYADGVLTISGSASRAAYEAVLQSLEYDNSSEDPGASARQIQVTVNDGKVDSNVATSIVTVTPQNDAPTVDLDNAAAGVDTTAAFTEDDPALTLAPRAAVGDADSADLASATVTLTNRPDGSAETLAADAGSTGITVTAYDSSTGVLALSGAATPAQYQQVLRTVAYANSSQSPSATSRSVAFSVSDGSAASPATATVTVTPVNDAPVVRLAGGVLDNSAAAFTESSPPDFPGSGPVAIAPAATVTDADTANLTGMTVTLTNRPDGLAESLSATASGGVSVAGYDSATGILALTGSASPAAYQAVLRTVSYNNLSDTPSATARTITVTATDGAVTPATSVSRTSTVSVTPTNDAPVASNKSYTLTPAVSNTAFIINTSTDGAPVVPDQATVNTPAAHQANKTVNIAANDPLSLTQGNTDPDGGTPGVFSSTNDSTANGGRVDYQSDGDFVYLPPPGCAATTDSFTYTIRDGSSPSRTATGTVTLALTGCVYYVDNTAPTSGVGANTGTSNRPYTAVTGVPSLAAGSTIYVYKGSGTAYQGTRVLATNQRLIGEAADLAIGGSTLSSGVPANRPLLTTLTSENTSVVLMGSGSTVRGVQIDPHTNSGISVTSVANGTIDDVRIIDTNAPGGTAVSSAAGIRVSTTTGTWDVSNLVIDNTTTGATGHTANSSGITIASGGTWNFKDAGTISIRVSGGPALFTDLSAATTPGPTSFGAGSVFDDITKVAGSQGGVWIANTSGTVTLGDGVGVDLDLTTTSGATAAFALNNAGTVTVPAAGTANVSATGGPAVSVSGTSGPALSFDTVSSAASTTNGISLSGLGAGTFSATGGSLGDASATAFTVSGGSGAITYPGAITNGAGDSASVTGRTGGAVTLNGSVTDSSDAGGGIALTSNTGGSTSFGAALTLNTGTSTGISVANNSGTSSSTFSGSAKGITTTTGAAVSLTNNTGHTATFSGGGLVLAASGAAGFTASGGGTVNVTGSGNTASAVGGPAVSFDGTTIGGSNAVFQRVSASNTTVGIRAKDTGSGRLLVGASSPSCTPSALASCNGGTIANLTGGDDSTTNPVGTGIVLANTNSPSFTGMYIHDASNYAIRGTNVTSLSLLESVINGVNGDNGTTPFDDSSVRFDNLSGSAGIANTFISGGYEDNLRIVNSSGSLNRLTMSSATIGDNSAAGGDDGVSLESSGSASLNATVQNSFFTGAAGDVLQFNHNGTGTGDLVVTNTAFSNTHPGIATGGGGLTLTNGGSSGTTSMNITGNTFRDAVGNALTIVKTTGTSTQTGTFSGNTIGVSGVANSGSLEGDALKIQTVGQGTQDWTVADNTIRQYNNYGIDVLAGGSASAQTGSTKSSITGNTIDQPGTNAATAAIAKNGIHFNVGTVPGDTYVACSVITGNSLATSGAPNDSLQGGEDIRLRQRQSTTIRLPGYAGGDTDVAAVAAFVTANNSAGEPSVVASTQVPFSGGGFTGGNPATC